MNRNLFYSIFALLLIALSIYFFYGREKSITNYPSLGTDIIAFGDSLVEGVGASTSNANFVSLLSKSIGKPILNLGVSGNTTIDGINRLNDLDRYNPKVVILLLGGNDYLKKIPIDNTFQNLEKIISDLQRRGAVVLVLGVRGGLFSDQFESRFEDLSEKYHTAYVSDVLDGLFANAKYMSDAIHPNDLGYKKIEERIRPVLSKLIK